MHHQQFYTEFKDWYNNGEPVLQHAHSLFHICKCGIVDCVIAVDDSNSQNEVDSPDNKIIQGILKDCGHMWRVMEMELSLMYVMYDILYTKQAWSTLGLATASCHHAACHCHLSRFCSN